MSAMVVRRRGIWNRRRSQRLPWIDHRQKAAGGPQTGQPDKAAETHRRQATERRAGAMGRQHPNAGISSSFPFNVGRVACHEPGFLDSCSVRLDQQGAVVARMGPTDGKKSAQTWIERSRQRAWSRLCTMVERFVEDRSASNRAAAPLAIGSIALTADERRRGSANPEPVVPDRLSCCGWWCCLCRRLPR